MPGSKKPPKLNDIEELIRTRPDLFDYPDCGDPTRTDTGIAIPDYVAKEIERRKKERQEELERRRTQE